MFPLSVAVFPSLNQKRAEPTADKMLTILDLHYHSSVLRKDWVQIKTYDFWPRSATDGTDKLFNWRTGSKTILHVMNAQVRV